jgi:hypothetical protein
MLVHAFDHRLEQAFALIQGDLLAGKRLWSTRQSGPGAPIGGPGTAVTGTVRIAGALRPGFVPRGRLRSCPRGLLAGVFRALASPTVCSIPSSGCH